MRQYLPTGRFSAIISSILFAGLLIYAAQKITTPSNSIVSSAAADASLAAARANWEETLHTIQEEAGVTTPTPPSETMVKGMQQAAQSSNVTDTVARSLLVNLTNAKSQGLGDDIPTQNKLITNAVNQIKQVQRTNAYTQKDITIEEDTKASQQVYGNALALVLAAASGTEYRDTLIAIDNATSNIDPSQLKKLTAIAGRYKTLTAQLLKLPVPQTLAPFHMQLVNNFKNITDVYPALQNIISDPLQGLAGVQTYQSLTKETGHVFINIAQSFNKNGILFNKGEPGAAWASLLSAQ